MPENTVKLVLKQRAMEATRLKGPSVFVYTSAMLGANWQRKQLQKTFGPQFSREEKFRQCGNVGVLNDSSQNEVGELFCWQIHYCHVGIEPIGRNKLWTCERGEC